MTAEASKLSPNTFTEKISTMRSIFASARAAAGNQHLVVLPCETQRGLAPYAGIAARYCGLFIWHVQLHFAAR